MFARWMTGPVALLAIVAGFPYAVMAQLQSVDQALEISKKTGRPIFAMAGNKT
jgi:hypothetical protein